MFICPVGRMGELILEKCPVGTNIRKTEGVAIHKKASWYICISTSWYVSLPCIFYGMGVIGCWGRRYTDISVVMAGCV